MLSVRRIRVVLPAPSSRFRHCHARLLGGTRPLHASGQRSTPATRAWRATPARRSRTTAAAAASREPYRSHNARNRIVVSADGSASSCPMSMSRSSTCIDNFPNPLSVMPDALYIPGAPSLVRPLKDNLSDPRCSAQHSPLPHRAPHGRSPFTVAPVNRTPAGHPEPRIGRIRRLQPSAFHPKSYYHPSARRAVRSATPSSAAAHMGRPAIALPRLQGVRRGAWRPR